MTILNALSPDYGSRKKFKRRGRGIGSGKGKTCGRGGKGQTARSGVAVSGFEGGQMPIYIRLPIRGFNSLNRRVYHVISLSKLNMIFGDMKGVISINLMREKGLLKGKDVLLKIVAGIAPVAPMHIEAHAITLSAREMLESAGGNISIIDK